MPVLLLYLKKHLKLLPVIIISLFFASFIMYPSKVFAAQTVSVTVGSPSGGNLVGAYVYARTTYGGGGCTTNSLGYCSISLPTPGNYVISASYGGFTPVSVTRYVGSGQFVSLRLNLQYGDGTGGTYRPPTPTPNPMTTVNVCVYRNGSPVSNGSIQVSWGSPVALGSNGCRIYYVNKYQTVGFTAYHGGQSKYGTVYVGAVPTSLQIDMPASTAPPKISTSQPAPKRVEGSILNSDNTLYKQPVTVHLKNTSSGQIGTQSTSSGYYAFTGLAGGTQSYEVYATLSNGTRLSGTKTFNLTSGTMTANFKITTGNPGITITKPPPLPTNNPTSAPSGQRQISGTILLQSFAGSNPFLRSVKVTATNSQGQSVSVNTSASTGKFLFSGLRASYYDVSFSVPSGYQAVGATSKRADFSLYSTPVVDFTIKSSTTASPTKAPTKPPSQTHTLSGTVTIQRANGTQNFTGGATITVKNNNNQTRSTTSLSDGSYLFSGLNAREYDVTITPPNGTKSVSFATRHVSFQNSPNQTLDFVLAESGNPTIAPTGKVNLTVRVQDIRGGAIKDARVGVDPDGRGYYYTNNSGEIVAQVDKNVPVSINAFKDGFKEYRTTEDVIIGTTNISRTITLQADSPSQSNATLNVTVVEPAGDPNRPTATNPINGATVNLYKSGVVQQTKTTGPNGSVSFDVIQGQSYNILPQKNGYNPVGSQSVTINGSSISRTMTLTPLGTNVPEFVNLKLTFWDTSDRPIPNVQVGVDPDGKGYYHTDASGAITATVRSNITVSVNANKDGYKPFTRSGIPTRDSDQNIIYRLEPDVTSQPTATPIIATAKINLTVKVQDIRGGPISEARVGIGPQGPGLYYTNEHGIVTVPVNRNGTISIDVSKDGYTAYNEQGINVGPSNTTRVVTLEGATTTIPTSTNSPVQNTKKVSGKILQASGNLYTGDVIVTLKNTRTGQESSQTIDSGTYIFANLNNISGERYEVRAELINNPSYTLSEPISFTLELNQQISADFYTIPVPTRPGNTNITQNTTQSNQEPQTAPLFASSEVSVSLQGVSDSPQPAPSQLRRPVTLNFYDINNDELVESVEGNVTYNENTQTFEGEVLLPETLAEGEYQTTITSPGYLTENTSDTVTISAGETVSLPPVTLITGDIDNDNQLTILDYTQILDCYSVIQAAKNCNDEKLKLTDLTDDGIVNQFDYNLFIRNLINKQKFQN